jgi:hypothetical protein
LEKAKDSRTCEDMSIESYFCCCSDFVEIPISEALQIKAVLTTVELGIKAINKSQETAQDFCMPVSFNELRKVEVKQTREDAFGSHNFKVMITLKENTKATFNLISYMAIPKEFKYVRDDPKLGSGLTTFDNLGSSIQVKVQLRELIRVDAYRGLCEETARIVGTSAAQCICYRPENHEYDRNITQAQTDLLLNLTNRFTLRLGEAGQDCEEVCQSFQSSCQDWGLDLYNKLEMLMQPWRAKGANVHYQDEVYEFRHFNVTSDTRGANGFGLKQEDDKWELFLSEWDKLSCHTKTVWLKPLCPCSK